MKKLLKNNLFLLLIILMVVFSFAVPLPGLFIKKIGLLPLLTFIAMFISGLSLSLENVNKSLKNIKIILFSSFTAFVVFPAVAYILAGIFFSGTYDAFVGAIIISTQASTVTSAIVLTMAACGNVPLAIVITVVNNMISAFISPVLLNFFLSMERTIEFDVAGMILNLVIVLILPIILAQLFKMFFKKLTRLIDPFRKKTANLVVLMFVMIGASTAASEVAKNIGVLLLIILFSAVLHLIILIICYLYAKLVKAHAEDIPPLLFCSSEKTMTTSTMIWGTYFSSHLIAPLVIVAYHLIQIVMDSFIAGYMSRRITGMRDGIKKT